MYNKIKYKTFRSGFRLIFFVHLLSFVEIIARNYAYHTWDQPQESSQNRLVTLMNPTETSMIYDSQDTS